MMMMSCLFPGLPITVSCAYSGRVAIAYRMGHVRVQGHSPDNKFINLYVAIYECESTGMFATGYVNIKASLLVIKRPTLQIYGKKFFYKALLLFKNQ